LKFSKIANDALPRGRRKVSSPVMEAGTYYDIKASWAFWRWFQTTTGLDVFPMHYCSTAACHWTMWPVKMCRTFLLVKVKNSFS